MPKIIFEDVLYRKVYDSTECYLNNSHDHITHEVADRIKDYLLHY